MDELVILKNDQALTDSLTVAKMFGKRHSNVVHEIERRYADCIHRGCAEKLADPIFYKSWYKNEQNGERYTMYLMNKRAFMHLVTGFTGKRAYEWKNKFFDAFDAMQAILEETHTQPWITARHRSKLIRQEETDMLKRLVEYAKTQGSENSNMLYMVYSKLANRAAGITDRDESDVEQLCLLIQCENMIMHVIRQGISEKMFYKDIYKACKSRLDDFLRIGFLDTTERRPMVCQS